jgi:hypothetical protein
MRITPKQKALLLDLDFDGGMWAGAWESLCDQHGQRTLESLLARGLIECWRACQDTEYYMLTAQGRRALLSHWAALEKDL